jgi:hypothetical protein
MKTWIFLGTIGLLAIVLNFTLLDSVSAQSKIAKRAALEEAAVKELVFGYEQAVTDLLSIKEWTLFIRATSGGNKENQIVIPYTGGNGPFTTTQTFTITGEAGSVVRKYFVLDAVSKNGTHSDVSNEIFYDFQIPFGNVTVPLNLTVKVKVLVQ